MSKVYEALQQAYRTRTTPEKVSYVPQIEQTVEVMEPAGGIGMEEEMLGLHKNIDSLLPPASKRILQFIGSRQSEGTSTVVREFAMVTATKMGKRVLLLDADRLRPSHHMYFKIKSGWNWQDAVVNGDVFEEIFHQVPDSTLFVSPSANSTGYTPEIFDSPRFMNFWEKLLDRFDLILIDSPPLNSSPDGLAIAPRVNGVILVVEAEKTRWQIVKSASDRIRNVGGNILGIVFNKRRYYIPDVIYRNL